jgi:hypothetical protein
LISGAISLSPFWNRGVPDVPANYDAGINRGLGVPAGFYHFAFEAGSPAGLAEKRDALRAKGVETTDISGTNRQDGGVSSRSRVPRYATQIMARPTLGQIAELV